jgi:hypothetical protein
MKLFVKLFFFVLILISIRMNAQDKDYSLGSNLSNLRFSQQSGFFDFSDPEAINIKVAVWGWVRYPGRYTIPNYTTLSDFLSLAGGPTDGAELENIKVYRTLYDSTQVTLKFNYDDFYRDENSNKTRKNPVMQAGDIVAITGVPRIFFTERFSMWLSVLSVLSSLSILILNIVRK